MSLEGSSTTYIEFDSDADTLGTVVIALIFSFGILMIICSVWKWVWYSGNTNDTNEMDYV